MGMHSADDDGLGEAASPWWSEESTRNFVVATPGMSSDDEAASEVPPPLADEARRVAQAYVSQQRQQRLWSLRARLSPFNHRWVRPPPRPSERGETIHQLILPI